MKTSIFKMELSTFPTGFGNKVLSIVNDNIIGMSGVCGDLYLNITRLVTKYLSSAL